MRRYLLIMMAALLLTGTVLGADGSLPGGTSISITITAPSDGAVKVSPPGEVDLLGSTSVGEGVAVPNTLFVYVLDVSYSTMATTGCGGDQNSDGTSNTILDCEIYAARTLNTNAAATGTVGEVGAAVFGGKNVLDPNDVGGMRADVGPASGDQYLTGPATDDDTSGSPDIEQVLTSAFSRANEEGGVALFTVKDPGSDGTNFGKGLEAAAAIAGSSGKSNRIIVFMSDGLANTGPSVSGVSVPAGVIIYTFAIGSSSSCTSDPNGLGSLQEVAAMGAAGSQCIPVPTPEELPDIVPGIIAAELTGIKYNLDGGPYAPVSTTDSDPPWIDPVTVIFGQTVSPVPPGVHQICAKAEAFDGGGAGEITECIEVTIVTIGLTPEEETNEWLGEPGVQQHTVTATLAAGAAGGVSGLEVDFEVTAGPNAGASASDVKTDANGQASFTYTAVGTGPAGLGTDTIKACFGPDPQGDTICDTVLKHWVDTTPPDGACPPGPNPAGKVPPAKGGQRPDGFYALTATDAVDPSPQIFVMDTGSGTIFGPFPSVTNIKYTQAPGATPVQKPMTGEVAWHITGTGDAAVYAVDASGNVQDPVSCLVPPPPK